MVHKKQKFLKFSLYVFFALFLSVFCIHKIFNFDIWWHLKTGEYILTNHIIPKKDIYTYTVLGNEWIDLHWLFQIIVYSIKKIVGFNGLIFLVYFIISSVFLTMYLSLKNEVEIEILLLIFGYAVLLMEDRFFVRPEIFSYLFMALNIYFLRKDKITVKPAILLSFIQLLWVNMQGLFVVGIVGAVIYFIHNLLLHFEGKKSNVRLSFFLVVLILLVSFINPYGMKGVLFPLKLFTRVGPEKNLFRLNIKEFLSPVFNSGFLMYKFYLVLYFISLLTNFRNLSYFEVLYSIAFCFLSVFANRNINLFVLASIPVTAKGVRQMLISGILKRIKVPVFLASIVCFSYIGFQAVKNDYFLKKASYKRFGFGVCDLFYPKKEVDFYISENLKGKLFNDIGSGSYAIYFFYPERKVYIDGRLEVIGGRLFSEFINAIANIDEVENFLDEKKFDYVLFRFEPGAEKLTKKFFNMRKWIVLSFSNSGFLLGRKKDNFKYRDNLKKEIYKLSKYIKKEMASEIYSKKDPVFYYYYGDMLYCMRQYKLALLFLLEGIKVNPKIYYFYQRAAEIYMILGEDEFAEYFFLEALKLNKKDSFSLFSLARLYIRKKMFGKALKFLNNSLKYEKNNETFLFYKSIVLYKLKRYNEAFFLFAKVYSLSNDKDIRKSCLENMIMCRKLLLNKKKAG